MTDTDKMRKLLLTLELIALIVSAILILIDYRLKKDVLQLFMKVERKIDQAIPLLSPAGDIASHPVDVLPGNLVANDAGMETANGHHPASAAGGTEPGPGASEPAKRARGTRNTGVPKPDKPVGT